MNQAYRIVLLGNSVLMDSIANCLAVEMPANMVRFDDLIAYRLANTDSLPPDIIVFELQALPAGKLFQLMPEYPKTQWVAMDPYTSQVSVMTGRRFATKAMKDLLHVIQEIIPGSAGRKGGKWTEPAKLAHQAKE